MVAALALSSTALAASPPATVQTYVEAPGPSGPLKGTMLVPQAGATAMVLIIPGSGPRVLPRKGWEASASTSAACLAAARPSPIPTRSPSTTM